MVAASAEAVELENRARYFQRYLTDLIELKRQEATYRIELGIEEVELQVALTALEGAFELPSLRSLEGAGGGGLVATITGLDDVPRPAAVAAAGGDAVSASASSSAGIDIAAAFVSGAAVSGGSAAAADQSGEDNGESEEGGTRLNARGTG